MANFLFSQFRFDFRRQTLIFRFHVRRDARNDLTVFADQKFLEIPQNIGFIQMLMSEFNQTVQPIVAVINIGFRPARQSKTDKADAARRR